MAAAWLDRATLEQARRAAMLDVSAALVIALCVFVLLRHSATFNIPASLSGALGLLTTDARTSYPWPLCWGNALWGYIAYGKGRAHLPPSKRGGPIFACAASFVLYTMPANLVVNYLIFGRTPSALTSTLVLPVHLACCLLIEWCPADALRTRLGATSTFIVLDSLGVLDNATTGLNCIEEAHITSGSPVHAVLAGMAVNLGGMLSRHFAFNGYAAGAVAFDANLRVAIGYSLAVSLAYLFLVVLPCAGAAGADPGRLSDACVDETRLYMVLPWLAVGKNLYGYLPGKQVYRRSRSPAKRKVQ